MECKLLNPTKRKCSYWKVSIRRKTHAFLFPRCYKMIQNIMLIQMSSTLFVKDHNRIKYPWFLSVTFPRQRHCIFWKQAEIIQINAINVYINHLIKACPFPHFQTFQNTNNRTCLPPLKWSESIRCRIKKNYLKHLERWLVIWTETIEIKSNINSFKMYLSNFKQTFFFVKIDMDLPPSLKKHVLSNQ